MIDATIELTSLGKQEAEKISDAANDPKYTILSLIYEGDGRMGADEIQALTGMSEETCRKALRYLAKKGFIKKAQ